MAVNWSANSMKSDMGTQLSPKVSARKAHRVLVPMSVLCLDGTASYAILVLMMIFNFLFPDGFFTFLLMFLQYRVTKLRTPPPSGEFLTGQMDRCSGFSLKGRLSDFPDRVPQDQQNYDGAKHQAGKAYSKRKQHTRWHHQRHREEAE